MRYPFEPESDGGVLTHLNIAGYRIEKRIGQGGMAKVYLAIQESLDRPVALKVLSPAFGESPEFSERFLNEGRILASLRHSNIVTIYDIGVDAGMHYISMEYVEGMDLKTRLREGILPSTALNYIETLASCLQVAHERDIVHRDIKPANVLFRDDGTLLLTDFGIAKKLGETSDLTIAGSMMGTPTYLSPEQAQAKPVDGRSDIYSLGIMLYEMLMGQKPYKGDSDIDTALKHISEPVPALADELRAFQPLVNKMMAKAPADRFSDVAELISAIRAFRINELELLSTLDGPHAGPASLLAINPPPPPAPAPAKVSPAAAADDTQTEGSEFTPTMVASAQSAPTPFDDTVGWGGLPASAPRVDQDLDRVADTAIAKEAKDAEEARDRKRKLFPLFGRVTVLTVLLTAGISWWLTRLENPPTGGQGQGQGQEGFGKNVTETPQTVERSTVQVPANEVRASTSPKAALTAQPAATPADSPTPAREETAETAREETIGNLLDQAQTALANLRLTKPRDDNALRYFQQVQEMDPENKQAEAGYIRIADKYAELARSQLNKRVYAKATAYIDTGLKIDPENPRLLAVQEQVAQAKTSARTPASTPAPQGKTYKEDSPSELLGRIKKLFD